MFAVVSKGPSCALLIVQSLDFSITGNDLILLSVGFMLWHISGQGLLVGGTTLLYGLVFAVIRWRAVGIIGLVIEHGLIDFLALLMLPSLSAPLSDRPEIPHPAMLGLGLALIVLTPLALWLVYPRLARQIRANPA